MKTPLHRALFYCALLCWLGLISTGSAAEQELNEALIDRWIASEQAFTKWGDQHQEILSAFEHQQPQSNNPLAISAEEMVRPIQETGLRASAETMLSEYGFDSLEDWASLTLRITKSAAALQVAEQKQSLDTSKLEALEKSGQLTKEQQAMVSRAIEQNQAMLNYLETSVSQQDIEAIRPFMEKLSTLLSH